MNASIVKIEIIDPAAEEALVTVSDGHFSCVAYRQPCRARVGDTVQLPLSALFTGYIYRQSADTPIGFRKGPKVFDWVVCGVVTDRKESIVRVGEIEVSAGMTMPGDIDNGDIVEFDCERLDFVR